MTMMMVPLHSYKNVVMAVTLSDCHLDIVEQNISNLVNHSRLAMSAIIFLLLKLYWLSIGGGGGRMVSEVY